MTSWKTEQEKFWAEDFGSAYIERNNSRLLESSNYKLFSEILSHAQHPISTIIELGANIGMNVKVLNTLLPDANVSAVEINKSSFELLAQLPCTAINQSILDFNSSLKFDLVFTKGVLIHIDPDSLNQVYELMHKLSQRYILIAEYYSPNPVALEYRGERNKLFKRDFAGEMLDKFEDLKLVNYGFAYHRGKFPQDDINWFLLEKY